MHPMRLCKAEVGAMVVSARSFTRHSGAELPTVLKRDVSRKINPQYHGERIVLLLCLGGDITALRGLTDN